MFAIWLLSWLTLPTLPVRNRSRINKCCRWHEIACWNCSNHRNKIENTAGPKPACFVSAKKRNSYDVCDVFIRFVYQFSCPSPIFGILLKCHITVGMYLKTILKLLKITFWLWNFQQNCFKSFKILCPHMKLVFVTELVEK